MSNVKVLPRKTASRLDEHHSLLDQKKKKKKCTKMYRSYGNGCNNIIWFTPFTFTLARFIQLPLPPTPTSLFYSLYINSLSLSLSLSPSLMQTKITNARWLLSSQTCRLMVKKELNNECFDFALAQSER